VDSSAPYFPYCRHCYVHQGFNQESSHHPAASPGGLHHSRPGRPPGGL
jgi:hypothetical protein